jgi:hypothetical protein
MWTSRIVRRRWPGALCRLVRSGVASLTERLPEALLLSAPELAEQLVQTWLVALMEVPAAERELLLDTLENWVAAAVPSGGRRSWRSATGTR